MNSLYCKPQDKLIDSLVANLKVDTSLRYSLTEGGKLLPFSAEEKQHMREARAQAIARLTIEKAMQNQALMPFKNNK